MPSGTISLGYLLKLVMTSSFGGKVIGRQQIADLHTTEFRKRHSSVSVKIVPYHKSPLLIETHDTSTEAMKGWPLCV